MMGRRNRSTSQTRSSRKQARAALLEALEGRLMMAADLAGNTLATARVIAVGATASSYSDFVGTTDRVDYYKFTLGAASDFSLAMTGLTNDADVQLLNGAGTVIAASTNPWTWSESIGRQLAAGTYYVRVYPYSGGTNYTLTVGATAVPVDTAGSTRATSRDLGAVTTAGTTVTEYVGTRDASDVYKFTESGSGTVTIGLTGLSADADLYLYDASGTLITSSTQGGTASENITQALDAGTYYVLVSAYRGSTTYSLSLASSTASTPTPAPTPSPAPSGTGSTTANATITTRALTSEHELDIIGTTGNDAITVTQSGTTLTIVANGNTTTVSTAGIGEIAIWGGTGNDTLTVNASVTLATRLYGGAGTDVLTDRGTGRETLVAIGGGADTLTGNGASYWYDTSDTANVTAADRAAGRVHVVSAFYQGAGSVPLELNGQNLVDPADAGATVRYTNRSLWGSGPTAGDVNQGDLGDCYLLATLAGMAYSSPARLLETAVDLGDGTYAVQFFRNGVATYVRVDGDLSVSGGQLVYNDPGVSGNVWASIEEKAYAVFATAQHTYAAIEGGLMSTVFTALGVANTTTDPSRTGAGALYSQITAALAVGRAVTLGTMTNVAAGVPVYGSHAYTVISASVDGAGNITYVVRNPWGIDGLSDGSNPNDGLVTVTAGQLAQNFDLATWATA